MYGPPSGRGGERSDERRAGSAGRSLAHHEGRSIGRSSRRSCGSSVKRDVLLLLGSIAQPSLISINAYTTSSTPSSIFCISTGPIFFRT